MRLKDRPLAFYYLNKLLAESNDFSIRLLSTRSILEQEFPGMFPLRASRGHVLKELLTEVVLSDELNAYIADETVVDAARGDIENIRIGSNETLYSRALELAEQLASDFVFPLSEAQRKTVAEITAELLCDEELIGFLPLVEIEPTYSVKMQATYEPETEEIVIRVKAPMTKGEAEQLVVNAIERLQEKFVTSDEAGNALSVLEAEMAVHEKKVKSGKSKKGDRRERYLQLREQRREKELTISEEKEFQKLRAEIQEKSIFQQNKKVNRVWQLDDELELQRLATDDGKIQKRQFDVFRKRRLVSLLKVHGYSVKHPKDADDLKITYGNFMISHHAELSELGVKNKPAAKYIDWLSELKLAEAQRHLREYQPIGVYKTK